MTQHISADFRTLMEQASGTVARYLWQAIEAIDKAFGKGYARKNPSLVGAFIQASATEMTQAVIAQQIRAGLEALAESTSLTDVEPIAEALDNIAGAIEENCS
jgi:hypothetical protein